MRISIGLLIFISILLLFDLYVYLGLKSVFSEGSRSLRIYQIVYILSGIFIYYCFFKANEIAGNREAFRSTTINFYIGIVFTAFVAKFVFLSLMFLQDAGRVLYGCVDYFSGSKEAGSGFLPGRRRFLTLAAAGIAAIPFAGMLYGITKGKYRYTVNKVKLSFKDLPKAFEGFKIVQISDIHAGSLDSKEDVARGVQMINDESPDVILFTGDLVNSDKEEINPFIDIFEKLKARHGKFSVLGNHDYYGVPRSEREEGKNTVYWEDFFRKYEAMGFQLMNNESQRIEKDGEHINILGVENWGGGRWFPKLGDLDKTLENINDDEFCVLMSHDPSHWDEKVLPHNKHIHLTLSGHTHGFQFGVNLPGFKWSPAQYRYPRWMGLYKEAEQYLYVNRGFGFLAFPGRVGMWPEITVLELVSA